MRASAASSSAGRSWPAWRPSGLVILATNVPDVLDRAVERRLAYQLRFPAPDAVARAAIWRRHIPDAAPRSGELDFARLGERFTLTGGRIKNAVLRAAFRAASRGSFKDQATLEAAAAEEQGTSGGSGARGLVGFR